MLKFYTFIAYERKTTIKGSLPFCNSSQFFNYIKYNHLKLIEYRITNKSFTLSKKELLRFTEYLLSLLKSNIKITLALEIIASQEKEPFAHIINCINTSITNGEGIYNSFAYYKEIFPDTYLNLLNAGEKTGNIVKNLNKAYEELLLLNSLNEKIKHSLFYPAIVCTFIFFLLIFIFTSVLPNFEEFFKDSKVPLPPITKLLLSISKNFKVIIFTLLIITLTLFAIFKFLPKNKLEILQMKIPIIKTIIKKNIIVQFSQNLYIMLQSDIGILDALSTIEKSCSYIFFKKHITTLILYINHGYSIYDSFETINFFDRQQLKLINIGEKTDTLSQTFETIALSMQKDIEKTLFKFTTLLQPILLSILGIVIGIIILAIYLPIFNISEIIL